MRVRCCWVLTAVAAAGLGLCSMGVGQVELRQTLNRMPRVFGKPQEYRRKGQESIYAIARRFGVSASAIYNANEGDLKAGDELLLIPTQRIAPAAAWELAALAAESPSSGTAAIVVNLAERNLYVYHDGRPVACYPVAIGMRGWETPTGEFTIVNKRKNPTWFPPRWAIEEKPVPPGPQNPLGDRWMGLSIPGYGIHATNAPPSVGRYVSHGCIRMYPEHAHALYELVRVGTPVKIVYEPVVLGYDPDGGMVYVAHHPDPYRLGEASLEEVGKRLEEWGLGEVMDEEAVAKALEKPRGTPAAIIGSGTRVSVGGRLIALALAPTRKREDWLVPAEPLASALGAHVEIGPGANFVSFQRGMQSVFLSPGNVTAVVNGEVVELEPAPQLAAGYPLVPLAAVARALGASVGFDQATQTVLIWEAGPGPGWQR